MNVAGRRSEWVCPKRELASDVTDSQCDQVRPTCSQCLRSKDSRPCPGYRDEQTLKFVDEGSNVARKVQAKQAIKSRRRAHESENSGGSSDSSTISPSSDDPAPALFQSGPLILSPQGSPIPRVLAHSLQSQGIRYFLANYVMSDSDLCAGHLQSLASWKTTQSKTLKVAMEAVGLAALSNQRRDRSLMARARHQYAIALYLTKSHLQDPFRCKQDRTITAVALLGLFEVCLPSHPMLYTLTPSTC